MSQPNEDPKKQETKEVKDEKASYLSVQHPNAFQQAIQNTVVSPTHTKSF